MVPKVCFPGGWGDLGGGAGGTERGGGAALWGRNTPPATTTTLPPPVLGRRCFPPGTLGELGEAKGRRGAPAPGGGGRVPGRRGEAPAASGGASRAAQRSPLLGGLRRSARGGSVAPHPSAAVAVPVRTSAWLLLVSKLINMSNLEVA